MRALLRGLCDGIVTPAHPGRGPKPIAYSDAIFGIVAKVYSGMSARRATGDIRACAEEGHISRAPSYNSILASFDKAEMTPILMSLIEQSAKPLASIETSFAVDSTGFGTSVYRRWYDAKYGREMSEATWLKAHVITGVSTNIITAISVTDGSSHDSPELPALVATTGRTFTLAEVSADKAYLSNANLTAIEAAGAMPYVPFKSNSKGDGSPAWRRMWVTSSCVRKTALHYLHARLGTWIAVARTVRIKRATLRRVRAGGRVKLYLARKVAALAGVPVEDLRTGKFPPSGACPQCGHSVTDRV